MRSSENAGKQARTARPRSLRPLAARPRSLRPLAAGATAVAVALGSAGGAIAASSGPTLVKPANHGAVHANKFKLVVRDASSLARRYGVFVSISRSRRTKRNGELKKTSHVDKGESFVKLKPWKGHAGMWIYKPPRYSFRGYWADTAGRYYWQAEHTDCNLKGCEALSRIESFEVRG